MILSDKQIKEGIKEGSIVIEPYDPSCLGSNSYDVHLSKHLATYGKLMLPPKITAGINNNTCRDAENGEEFNKAHMVTDTIVPSLYKHDLIHYGEHVILDAKKHNEVIHFEIPDEGFVLLPGNLYLGSTIEYTETHYQVPFLDGKSSIGRLGIFIHATAGKGDVGFCGIWTLEIVVTVPVRVYANMPIGQLFYHACGNVDNPYNKKKNAKYNNHDPKPKESMMYKNFIKEDDK